MMGVITCVDNTHHCSCGSSTFHYQPMHGTRSVMVTCKCGAAHKCWEKWIVRSKTEAQHLQPGDRVGSGEVVRYVITNAVSMPRGKARSAEAFGAVTH